MSESPSTTNTARRLWEVGKTGRVMSCEIDAHPFGWEIRCYVDGAVHYANFHPVRFAAEDEAESKRQELIALGWTPAINDGD